MKTKTNLCRLSVLALCLVLLVSLVPGRVQAAAPGNSDLTVSGLEEDFSMTVSAYQIITVSFENGQPETPMYSWNADIADWVRTNHGAYIETDGSVSGIFAAIPNNDPQLNAFYDSLAAYLRGNLTVLNPKTVAKDAGNTSCILQNLPMGNYLILVEGGMKVYRPSTVNRVPVWKDNQWQLSEDTVVLKSSEPSIRKTMTDQSLKSMSANIGDIIPYTILADIPTYPANATNKTYKIIDKLPDTITLDDTSIQVFLKTGDTQETLTTGYTKTGGENSFTLTFTYNEIQNADQVVVTYNGTVNQKAVPGSAAVNSAKLDYANNPYADGTRTMIDSTKVYTYGIKVEKKDKADNQPLGDAEFNLYKADPQGVKQGEALKFELDARDNQYYLSGESAAKPELVTSDENLTKGKLTIKGLAPGKYVLVETKAPGGYILPVGESKITLTADADPTKLQNKQNAYYDLEVLNQKGYSLPQTGGVGTILFSAGGILLAGMGVFVIVMLLRRKRSA